MQDSVSENRARYIGGSDIPVIMNISSFKTRWELLQEKAQIKVDEFEGNKYTSYGQRMEDVIREHINNNSMVYGEPPFHEDKFIKEAGKNDPIGVRCHCDGLNPVTILEIKTTSEVHEKVEEYVYYLVQLLYYMIHFKKRYGMLAVYARPDDMSEEFDMRRLQVFRIDIEDYQVLVAEIKTAIKAFKKDLKKLKADPTLQETDFIPKPVVRDANKLIKLEQKVKAMKQVEDEVKAFRKELKDTMLEYGVKTFRTPNGILITRVDDTPSSVKVTEELDLDLLRSQMPELFKPVSEGGYLVKKSSKVAGKAGHVKVTFPKEN